MQPPPSPTPPTFVPRGLLMASAFGGALGRSISVGLIGAAVAGAFVGLAAPGGFFVWAVILAGAAAVIAGSGVAILVVPRRLRLAYEAYAWLGRRELDRFQARTASSAPSDPAAAVAWLDEHVRSATTAAARIELLTMLGRYPEAEAEYVLLAPPADDDERVERAGLRTFLTFAATGELEQGDLEALVTRLDPRSGVGLEAATLLALGEARLRRDRDDPAWPEPLVAVRRRLGSAAFAVTVRDTWSRALLPYGIVGAICGAMAAGLRAALGG